MNELTEEQRIARFADEALQAAGYVRGPAGWAPGPELAAKERQTAERREERRQNSGFYDAAQVKEPEGKALLAKRNRATARASRRAND